MRAILDFLGLVAVPSAAQAAVVTGLESRQSSTTVTANTTQQFQRIDGFGFSEAFQRAYNIVDLDEPLRSELVDLLFNATSGAGFTIVRNGIGSSPNSSNDWMNTIEPVSPGSPSAQPTYVWDDKDSGQLWVSQQAVKYGVKTFYADAWSAPGYMKTDNSDDNGGALCGVTGASCASGDWRQAFANYLVEYINLYAESGVNVTHLGFLNEPDISTSYASMQMSGAQAADFINVLYPTLKSANLSNVEVACCDGTGWSVQTTYTQALNSAGVAKCSDLSGSWSTAWDTKGGSGDGFVWANDIYLGLTTGNVNAYLWWVATQDPITNGNKNEKLILVDDTAQTYDVSKRLWAFAQYSRTARPGAVRVGASSNNGELKTTAFVNTDGSVAVNIINVGTSAVPISITGAASAGLSAAAWTTDNNNMTLQAGVEVGSDGSVAGVSAPARGMISFMIWPAKAAANSTMVASD